MDECPPTASLESRGSDAIMAAHDNTLAMTITENRKSLRRDDVKNAVPRRLEQSGLDHWSRRFARLVTGSSPTGWPPGEVVGLEHEYRLTYDARAVDFRTIVHSLDLGRPLLDPADLNAYRLTSGAALTADEAEAEIALAPSLVRPGCGLRIADAARSERQALEARLPKEAHLKGYSTHLSVAVCPSSSAAMAKLYLSSFERGLDASHGQHLLTGSVGAAEALPIGTRGRVRRRGQACSSYRLRARKRPGLPAPARQRSPTPRSQSCTLSRCSIR